MEKKTLTSKKTAPVANKISKKVEASKVTTAKVVASRSIATRRIVD